MKKFAVVLSGCGVFDGAEIHEATLTLLAIAEAEAGYEIFAPDVDQHHVINHLTGEEMDEKRNVLVESARIARGKIKPLSKFNADNFDAIIFPGGFGAAKNLSTFALDGTDMKVNDDVKNAVLSMHSQGKPIGALCISPVLVVKIIEEALVTIGNDTATREAILRMGGKHKNANHGEVVTDHDNNIYTTPCYMLNANIMQIYDGASNLITAIMEDLD